MYQRIKQNKDMKKQSDYESSEGLKMQASTPSGSTNQLNNNNNSYGTSTSGNKEYNNSNMTVEPPMSKSGFCVKVIYYLTMKMLI